MRVRRKRKNKTRKVKDRTLERHKGAAPCLTFAPEFHESGTHRISLPPSGKTKPEKSKTAPLKGKGCGTPSYFCASILTNEELIESFHHPPTRGREPTPSSNQPPSSSFEGGSCQTLLTCVLYESMLNTCRSWFRSGTYLLICIASSRRARRSKACPSRSTCSARYATPSTAPLSMKCESGFQTATPSGHDRRQQR